MLNHEELPHLNIRSTAGWGGGANICTEVGLEGVRGVAGFSMKNP